MFYIDTQRTLTRRESSLVLPPGYETAREEVFSARAHSTSRLDDSAISSVTVQPKGAVRKELITMMFESMLNNIVESWEVISPPKTSDSTALVDSKSPSELTILNKKKKEKGIAAAQKGSKTKRSRSKMEVLETPQQPTSPQQCWWSAPDERAIIHFKNGNIYEGSISMKSMNGEGRFQWADGTVYLGQFKDNEMKGKGQIQWKDDTWYEGDFAGNLRHGKGLYVDSRRQKFYTGGWHCGTKHGKGVIYYSSFKNSYDGKWVHNVRHGYGSREYCERSGYRGYWDKYVREGKGLMIWPNHDFYRGEWKNGVMSGYGVYIWEAYYNNTMSVPTISVYRGMWEKGERSGYGTLNLGYGLGSHYKGEFMNNKKHGVGTLVTNNGLILQDNKLFIDDNIGTLNGDNQENDNIEQDVKRTNGVEPYQFDICDDSVGLLYHIEMALKNIDGQEETRLNIINDFIENNRHMIFSASHRKDRSSVYRKNPCSVYQKDRPNSRKDMNTTDKLSTHTKSAYNVTNLENIIQFEEISLRKALRCYETELKNIYYEYATICNTEKIYFTPVLTRLYLWQFYYDCNVHDKGLNLVEIDRMFHVNPQWISRCAHDPFEKIYFWQFIHILISVARRLYAKTELPGTKPDTIMASALRSFMETDVIPGAGRRRGRLPDGYGCFVPLLDAYKLYRYLGEPHTVRKFICAARRPPHCHDPPQPPIIDTPDATTPIGRNAYIFAGELTFVTDEPFAQEDEELTKEEERARANLALFNIGNLSSKAIIKIFSTIFPRMYKNDNIMDLDIELTFYEFFEALVQCIDEGIRIKDEEMRLNEKFSGSIEAPPPSPSPGTLTSKAF